MVKYLMNCLLPILMLSCQLLTHVHAQEKAWTAEHIFKDGDATLQIDRKYLGGNSTSYEFRLAPLSTGNRLRFAIQWIRENGEVYDAIMFILRIRPIYEDNSPIIEYF